MGIRMHLAVGYGLDISDMNKSVIDDFDKLEDSDRMQKFISDVRTYAQVHDDLREKMFFHPDVVSKNGAPQIYEMVKYDSEFGLKDRLLLIPFGFHKTWHRYGDLLDIFEYEAYRKPDNWMDSEFVEKKGTLYPFAGLMRANLDHPLGIEEYNEPMYLDRKETKDAIPVAPRHLYFLIKHLDLVPEDQITETFLKLRPTVYRWFS